jgi:hypothetical protein
MMMVEFSLFKCTPSFHQLSRFLAIYSAFKKCLFWFSFTEAIYSAYENACFISALPVSILFKGTSLFANVVLGDCLFWSSEVACSDPQRLLVLVLGSRLFSGVAFTQKSLVQGGPRRSLKIVSHRQSSKSLPPCKCVFDCSNAVLGMAFTPPPLEKVRAFCTAETNFVLHSKQNKNKQNKDRQKWS